MPYTITNGQHQSLFVISTYLSDLAAGLQGARVPKQQVAGVMTVLSEICCYWFQRLMTPSSVVWWSTIVPFYPLGTVRHPPSSGAANIANQTPPTCSSHPAESANLSLLVRYRTLCSSGWSLCSTERTNLTGPIAEVPSWVFHGGVGWDNLCHWGGGSYEAARQENRFLDTLVTL